MSYPLDYSAGDQFTATDLNLLKNTNFHQTTAGAAINGATLPVPVYINNADAEVYACDANDTDKVKFYGFAVTNGTDGNPIVVQTSGVVPGFSGLTVNAEYYLSDTAGLITTTPSTTIAIKVGIAVSATEIRIQDNIKVAGGSGTNQSESVSTGTDEDDEIITVGFQPKIIVLSGKVVLTATASTRKGFGVVHYFATVPTANITHNDEDDDASTDFDLNHFGSTGTIIVEHDTNKAQRLKVELLVSAVSATGFTIRTAYTKTSGSDVATGGSTDIKYLAIG